MGNMNGNNMPSATLAFQPNGSLLVSMLNAIRVRQQKPPLVENPALARAAQAQAATIQSQISKKQLRMYFQGRNAAGELLPERIKNALPFAKVWDEMVLYAGESDFSNISTSIEKSPGKFYIGYDAHLFIIIRTLAKNY